MGPRDKPEGDDRSWWRRLCDYRRRCVNAVGGTPGRRARLGLISWPDSWGRKAREMRRRRPAPLDRQSGVSGTSVFVRVGSGGRRIIKKKTKKQDTIA